MKMNWEKRFTSLIKDTETNLSRVKNKFSSPSTNNVTWAPRSYSTPLKKSSSLLDIPVSTTPRFSTMGPGMQDDDMYNMGSSLVPYPSTQSLQERIEQQNMAIDRLTGVVHRLETDRHNYKEQIRDLRNEIFQLTERTGNQRPDPSMERRMEQMRREMLGEIQLLQSQLQISSAKGSNSNMSDTQLMSLSRDVLEIKHSFRDELEAFRRDLEILRSRVAKSELELASMLTGRRDVERRQDNLDRTLNSLTLTQKPQLPPSAVAIMNTNRQLEKLQLNELRSTLSALKDKIDILESSSQPLSSTISKIPDVPMKTSSRYSIGKIRDAPMKTSSHYSMGTTPTRNGSIDDLDLSDADTDSSDFTEFDPAADKNGRSKQKKDKDLDSVATDDLDIDDLDLSDDDLSQNSLSDHIDSDDFT